MKLMLTHTGRLNFTKKARCGRSCESRSLRNFRKRGRKPRSTWGMKEPDSLTGWYLRMLQHNSGQLLSICKLIVANAYFSKESFVSGVKSLGFDLINRFRDDVNLKYLYTGPKYVKRGRPQKFNGKVNLKNMDMNVFTEDYTAEGKLVYKMYTAVVWAVGLAREVRVVLVDCGDAEKKRQTRKVFFSTDTSMSARDSDIFDIYRTRFQPEFVFCDAKQFTGLTHCQARNREAPVVCLQRFAHVRQPREGLCPSTRAGSLRRFDQNPAAQRCNGGPVYCYVRKIPGHAIK